ENSIPRQSSGVAHGNFTYDELVVATNGFSDANLLGQSGFGYVHKGIFPSRKQIAVKQLKEKSLQGKREFQAEIGTISRVHHKHLASLVGYCMSRDERLLVYEFVPNKNLEHHLHGKGKSVMAWATRMKIAIGCAKGLAYLHEDCNPPIFHLDIKASNILVDYKFEAVSDFGLAKFFSDTNDNITHISTRVVGTLVLAPEYASRGKVTAKADVYSYGVMLLELITGRPPINTTESVLKEGFVGWATPLLTRALEDGNFNSLVDPQLEDNYNISEVSSMVVCAAACVRSSAWLRIQMSQVVRILEGDVPLRKFSEDILPGHSSVYRTSKSSNFGMKFKLIFGSQECGVSASSGITSEYGLNPSISSGE
ncbi:LOW QUALITY PROTEIN: Pkinase_Tyr domain-containing protein, partial [Cephalotus follicularis]